MLAVSDEQRYKWSVNDLAPFTDRINLQCDKVNKSCFKEKVMHKCKYFEKQFK